MCYKVHTRVDDDELGIISKCCCFHVFFVLSSVLSGLHVQLQDARLIISLPLPKNYNSDIYFFLFSCPSCIVEVSVVLAGILLLLLSVVLLVHSVITWKLEIYNTSVIRYFFIIIILLLLLPFSFLSLVLLSADLTQIAMSISLKASKVYKKLTHTYYIFFCTLPHSFSI